MDTTRRTLAKSITWQATGLFTMTIVGYLFTRSITAGGGIAIAGMMVGFVCYFLHEKLWSRIGWGQTNL